MKEYYDLELNILSCLLQRPELMKKCKLEDKHFAKTKRFWIFMKSFYKRFGNFDIVLMTKISKNSYLTMDYIEMLLDLEPAPSRFDEYQNLLIEMYEEKKKDKYIIEQIFTSANELYLRNINVKEFKEKCERTYKIADELYKED